jgi:hypothetical protein
MIPISSVNGWAENQVPSGEDGDVELPDEGKPMRETAREELEFVDDTALSWSSIIWRE